MTGLADWETEGARARPTRPEDTTREPAPGGLRATTWIGVALLVVAVGVLWATALVQPEEGSTQALLRVVVLVVVGVGLAVSGVVALLLRLVAGVLLRR